MLLIHYPKCGTCKKARAWLDEKGFSYMEQDIKSQPPTRSELKEFYRKSGKPLKAFFNTSGLVYKEKQLKDKLPSMSEEEQLSLLASDGMLIKRPILVRGDTVLVGFKESEWEKL